jgi:transposase
MVLSAAMSAVSGSRDCPPEYGPYTTIYNGFNRWSRQGLWFEMFEALTGSTGVIGTRSLQWRRRDSRPVTLRS